MHPAVELLLKRMESNPDEFVNPHQKNRRWEIIIEKYRGYMTEEDHAAVKKKYSDLQMEQCHKDIMAELLRTEESPPSQNTGQMSLPFGSYPIDVTIIDAAKTT